MALPLQSGLLEDVLEPAGGHIIARFPGYCHAAQLFCVLELAVTTALANQNPAVRVQQGKNFANFGRHGTTRRGWTNRAALDAAGGSGKMVGCCRRKLVCGENESSFWIFFLGREEIFLSRGQSAASKTHSDPVFPSSVSDRSPVRIEEWNRCVRNHRGRQHAVPALGL